MAIRISGPGVGLPFSRGVMPTTFGSPWQPPTNRIDLQGGQVLMIPAGTWIVQSQSTASELQYRDPTDEQWKPILPPTNPFAPIQEAWAAQLFSDGINYRVANISQVGTAATVTAAGSGYAQATTLVTPSAGNSTWQAIVGGALNIILTSPGSGYTIPPFVSIPAPGVPGHPARAIATLAADGSVASVAISATAGAGYKTPPAITIIPSPNDPNLDEIEDATAVSELTGAGTITAVLLVNFGMPLPAAPTLTISGSGSGATASVNPTAWVAAQDDLILLQPAAG